MKKVIVLAALFLFTGVQVSYAQFELKIAPITGMNFNIGSGSDLPKTATGLGMMIGAQTDMNFTPVIGIIANLKFYDNRSISFTEEGAVQGLPASQKITGSLAYFVIEPLLKISIPNSNFYFKGGPALGINVQGSVSSVLTVQGQQPQRQQQSLQNTNARFEFKLGAGMDIPISRSVYLAPHLSFGFGVTEFEKDFSARIMSLQVTTAVKFQLL